MEHVLAHNDHDHTKDDDARRRDEGLIRNWRIRSARAPACSSRPSQVHRIRWRIHQAHPPARSAARTTNSAVSIVWKVQNRLAG